MADKNTAFNNIDKLRKNIIDSTDLTAHETDTTAHLTSDKGVVYIGVGAPAVATAKVGDFYVDKSTNTQYILESTGWTKTSSSKVFVGGQGPDEVVGVDSTEAILTDQGDMAGAVGGLGRTYRSSINAATLTDVTSASYIQIQFKSFPSAAGVIGPIYIGPEGASAFDFDGNQVQVTFNGGETTFDYDAIGTTEAVLSDVLDVSSWGGLDGASDLVISAYCQSGSLIPFGAFGSGGTAYKSGGDFADDTDFSGNSVYHATSIAYLNAIWAINISTGVDTSKAVADDIYIDSANKTYYANDGTVWVDITPAGGIDTTTFAAHTDATNVHGFDLATFITGLENTHVLSSAPTPTDNEASYPAGPSVAYPLSAYPGSDGSGVLVTHKFDSDNMWQQFQPFNSDTIYWRRYDQTPIDYSDTFTGNDNDPPDNNKWGLTTGTTTGAGESAYLTANRLRLATYNDGQVAGVFLRGTFNSDFDIYVDIYSWSDFASTQLAFDLVGPPFDATTNDFTNQNYCYVYKSSTNWTVSLANTQSGGTSPALTGLGQNLRWRITRVGTQMTAYSAPVGTTTWTQRWTFNNTFRTSFRPRLFNWASNTSTNPVYQFDNFTIVSGTLTPDNPAAGHWNDWVSSDQASSTAVTDHETTYNHGAFLTAADTTQFLTNEYDSTAMQALSTHADATSVHGFDLATFITASDTAATVLTNDSKTNTAEGSTYPDGFSVMNATGSGGFPSTSNGTLATAKGANGHALQQFSDKGSTSLYFRKWDDTPLPLNDDFTSPLNVNRWIEEPKAGNSTIVPDTTAGRLVLHPNSDTGAPFTQRSAIVLSRFLLTGDFEVIIKWDVADSSFDSGNQWAQIRFLNENDYNNNFSSLGSTTSTELIYRMAGFDSPTKLYFQYASNVFHLADLDIPGLSDGTTRYLEPTSNYYFKTRRAGGRMYMAASTDGSTWYEKDVGSAISGNVYVMMGANNVNGEGPFDMYVDDFELVSGNYSLLGGGSMTWSDWTALGASQISTHEATFDHNQFTADTTTLAGHVDATTAHGFDLATFKTDGLTRTQAIYLDATGGTTEFATGTTFTSIYDVDVVLNGITLIPGTEYTDSGTSPGEAITLTAGVTTGDDVVVTVWKVQ